MNENATAYAHLPKSSEGNLGTLSIPVVLQTSASDCGVAALCMVLGYHGVKISLNELEPALSLGRGGCSAASLIRVGEQFGLQGRAIRLKIENIHMVPKASIVYWEFCHFVVFQRFSSKSIEIIDPAIGTRCMSLDKFKTGYSSAILVFDPPTLSPNSPPISLSKSTLRHLTGSQGYRSNTPGT